MTTALVIGAKDTAATVLESQEPTMTALVISPKDNVATALESIEAGRELRFGDRRVRAIQAIPRGHKIAIRFIPAGDPVLKYGSPIGPATVDILPGAHVHTHNLSSERGRGDLHAAPGSGARLAEPDDGTGEASS